MKRTLFFLIFLLSLSFFSFGCKPLAQRASRDAVNFSLLDIKDNKISLSDYKGKPVMLFFWATWCPYCVRELPRLSMEYDNLKSRGISVLAVNIGEKKDKVQRFMDNNKLAFPVLLDSDSKVANEYGLVGIPTFIFIDSQGKITYQSNGFPENLIQSSA